MSRKYNLKYKPAKRTFKELLEHYGCTVEDFCKINDLPMETALKYYTGEYIPYERQMKIFQNNLEKETGKITKTCVLCGKTFMAENNHQFFCSEKCEKKHFLYQKYPLLKQMNKRQKGLCSICGKPYDITDYTILQKNKMDFGPQYPVRITKYEYSKQHKRRIKIRYLVHMECREKENSMLPQNNIKETDLEKTNGGTVINLKTNDKPWAGQMFGYKCPRCSAHIPASMLGLGVYVIKCPSCNESVRVSELKSKSE